MLATQKGGNVTGRGTSAPGLRLKIVRSAVRQLLRRAGLELVRLPAQGTLDHHLGRLLDGLAVDCVVDVGAYVGEYAALCRRLGYAGRIVSFEPASDSYRRLAARARDDPEWKTVRCALGSVEGPRSLHVSALGDLSSFHHRSEYNVSLIGDGGRIVGEERVEVHRLDALLPTHVGDLAAPRVFLKVDTQGSDLDVLRGAEGVLPLVVGLHVELAVRPLYAGVVTYLDGLGELEGLGFELTGLFPVASEHGVRVIEFECLMTRPGAWTPPSPPANPAPFRGAERKRGPR